MDGQGKAVWAGYPAGGLREGKAFKSEQSGKVYVKKIRKGGTVPSGKRLNGIR